MTPVLSFFDSPACPPALRAALQAELAPPAPDARADRLLSAVDRLNRYRQGALTAQDQANLAGRCRAELPAGASSAPGAMQELLVRDVLAAFAQLDHKPQQVAA